MVETSVGTVIENYKNMVKELGRDPNPGHKAIAVYGGYMGKTFHTKAALNDIGLDECYLQPAFPYEDIRKNWIFNVKNEINKRNPIIILDSYWFPYMSCKEKIPEYNELIASISHDKFGFTLSKPNKYFGEDTDKDETIPADFYEIKSNLIFIVGYSVPNDLINIMPSFNFNFEGKQLLAYLRDNVDTIFPKLDLLTHEIRLEMIDLLSNAYEKGIYETFDFKWIKDAFHNRCIFEKKQMDGDAKDNFYEEFSRHLRLIKDKKIQ